MRIWSHHPLASTLQASLIWGALITGCEMVIAWLSGSSVLTLDSIYAVAETILSGLFVWSTRKLVHLSDRIPSRKSQNLLVRCQSVFMLGICGWALWDGIEGLFHPEPMLHFDLCIGFTVCAALAEIAMVQWLRMRTRQLNSPMIGIEAYSWTMDLWLDLGFLLSFVLGWWWQSQEAEWGHTASLYIGPALTIALGLLLLRKPIATLRHGISILVPQETVAPPGAARNLGPDLALSREVVNASR